MTQQQYEQDCEAPTEDDYTSTDYTRWYQYGKLVLITNVETCETELKSHMDKESFWPNAWFISDHGNHIQLEL